MTTTPLLNARAEHSNTPVGLFSKSKSFIGVLMLYPISTELDDDKSGNNYFANDRFEWKSCTLCGDDVHAERWAIGYRLCLHCGQEAAISDRASWCVVQTYGKGPYMLVTPEAAPQVLMDTNQKNPRSN
jgi:hypothetical protein